jgi:HK97 family phage prohead protease
MLVKTAPVEVKAVDAEAGTFEAIVSVFGNKDSYGDKVVPGAFAETLREWAAKGDPIPVYWSHRMDDPDFNIGWVLDAKEVESGLWVKGQLDLDNPTATSKAPQVHRLLKGRRVTQFSFAYDIVEAAFVETEDEWWYELRQLKLHEVGPTPIGANQDTELLAVKAAAATARHLAGSVKAGRVLSATNETSLRTALESIESSAAEIKNVLGALGTETEDDNEKASGHDSAKDEAPRGKSEELRFNPSAFEESTLHEIQLATAS